MDDRTYTPKEIASMDGVHLLMENSLLSDGAISLVQLVENMRKQSALIQSGEVQHPCLEDDDEVLRFWVLLPPASMRGVARTMIDNVLKSQMTSDHLSEAIGLPQHEGDCPSLLEDSDVYLDADVFFEVGLKPLLQQFSTSLAANILEHCLIYVGFQAVDRDWFDELMRQCGVMLRADGVSS